MSTSKIVRHTSKEMKKMKSETDWKMVKRLDKAGIEPEMSHPNDAEVTDEEFAVAMSKRGAGRPKKTSPKEHINLRVDADILAALRATGKGWQTRVNKALREYVRSHVRSA